MNIVLSPGWLRTKEKYPLSNDQRLKNVDNLISPCGETVSVFEVEEELNAGLRMFERMFRDYEKITVNLKLTFVDKFNIGQKECRFYVIEEKFSKKQIAHIFIENQGKLFVFIFTLKFFEKSSLEELSTHNSVLKEVMELLGVQK